MSPLGLLLGVIREKVTTLVGVVLFVERTLL